MIAAAIESCAEALTLAEKNGLDRTEVVAVVVLVLVVLMMVVLVLLVLVACFSTNAAAPQVMSMLNSTIFDCLIYKVLPLLCCMFCIATSRASVGGFNYPKPVCNLVR